MLRVAALAGASALIALALAELALRVTGLVEAGGLHTVSARDHGRIPGPWEPGQDVERRQIPALPHRVHTNALGLRGRETDLARRGERVLCSGDSFTFGDFVDDDETLPARLDARLGPHVEVLNGGVGGSTIVDQAVFLEPMLALEPDLVFLLYSENDLDDLGVSPPLHVQLAHNREIKSGILGPVYALARDSALFQLLLRVRGALRARQAADDAAWQEAAARKDGAHATAEPTVAADDGRVAEYVAAVLRLRDRLRDRGSGLVLGAYPTHLTLTGGWDRRTLAQVVAAVREAGVCAVDLTPALAGSGLAIDELYLLPLDGHPTPRGYEIAADAVAPHLRHALDGGSGCLPGAGAQ